VFNFRNLTGEEMRKKGEEEKEEKEKIKFDTI
jgi:hypothetical protein